jgi:choice-of-anchor C domain-containing protein
MMMKMIAAGFAALAFAGVAQAAGVQDGTFAEGATAGSFSTIGTNATIGDWTVTKGSVDLIGAYWQAPNATGYSLDLNGLTPGAVSQTLTLAAGEYTLSFWLAGNPDGGDTTKSVLVSAGSASQTFTFANSSSTTKDDMGWTLETLTFKTTGSTTLSFESTFGANGSYSPYGAAIGDISVSAVPEPATLGLLLAGLGMLGVMSSRRRVR